MCDLIKFNYSSIFNVSICNEKSLVSLIGHVLCDDDLFLQNEKERSFFLFLFWIIQCRVEFLGWNIDFEG